jgi:hypothetical protein
VEVIAEENPTFSHLHLRLLTGSGHPSQRLEQPERFSAEGLTIYWYFNLLLRLYNLFAGKIEQGSSSGKPPEARITCIL